jgi:hypothetical protein
MKYRTKSVEVQVEQWPPTTDPKGWPVVPVIRGGGIPRVEQAVFRNGNSQIVAIPGDVIIFHTEEEDVRVEVLGPQDFDAEYEPVIESEGLTVEGELVFSPQDELAMRVKLGHILTQEAVEVVMVKVKSFIVNGADSARTILALSMAATALGDRANGLILWEVFKRVAGVKTTAMGLEPNVQQSQKRIIT